MGLIALGFVICLASSGRGVPGVVYFGVFVAVIGIASLLLQAAIESAADFNVLGIYPAFPGNVTWISVNLAGDYKRAGGMAVFIGLGNLAGGTFCLGGNLTP